MDNSPYVILKHNTLARIQAYDKAEMQDVVNKLEKNDVRFSVFKYNEPLKMYVDMEVWR